MLQQVPLLPPLPGAVRLCHCDSSVTVTAVSRTCPAAGQGARSGRRPCGKSTAASAPRQPVCRFFRKDSLVLKVSESRRILGGRQTASSTIHTLGADGLDLDPDSGM